MRQAGLDWWFSVFSLWAVLLVLFVWPMLFQPSDIIPFMTSPPLSGTETPGYAVYMKFTGYHSTYHISGGEDEKLAFNTVKRGVKTVHTISMRTFLRR